VGGRILAFLSETAPAAGQSRLSTSRARRRNHAQIRTFHPDSASFCESGLVTAKNRHFPSFRHAHNEMMSLAIIGALHK